MKSELKVKISGLLHFALRSRNALLGYNRTLTSDGSKIAVVFLSSNMGRSSMDKIQRHCKSSELIILPEDENPGDMIGRGDIKVISVLKSEFSRKIIEYLKD